MYQLFDFQPGRARGTVLHPQWHNVKRGLVRVLDTVKTYYKTHTMSVTSSHFLTKILFYYGVDPDLDLRRYYVDKLSSALELGMTLKMTSSIYEGKSWSGVFYGPGIQEVLIASNESFDYDQVYKRWTEAAPVTVLSHPISNLALDLPDGLNRTPVKGYAVININIPMLMVMYRGFKDYQQLRFETADEARRTAMQFIHMYVLPNMLDSHLDGVLINRLHNRLFTETNYDQKPNHPFYIEDWTKRVDDFQDTVLDAIIGRAYNSQETLLAIPLVQYPNAFEYAPLPEVYRSRQITWAYTLARLTLLETMVKATRASGGVGVGMEYNYLNRMLLRYRQDRVWQSTMPQDLRNQIAFRIDRLTTML